MDLFFDLRAKLFGFKADPDLLNAYRSAIPSHVNIKYREEGGHVIAKITEIEHQKLPQDVLLLTEADNEEDLVVMLNDLVLSYKNIPESYRPYFRTILTPENKPTKSNDLALVKA